VNPSAPPDTAPPVEARNPPPTNENGVGEPAFSAPPPPPPKTLGEKLNLWFGGKPKTEKGIAPVAKGARYSYPPAVTLLPGNRRESERLVEQGAQARQQSHASEALDDFRQAVAADPTDFNANLQLGLTAIDTGDTTLALDALYRALYLDANSADARYAFAWTLSKRGFYFDAARELEKLLASHPQEVRAHLLLGNLYAEELGEPKLAREHYERVLALDPGNAQAGAIRAWVQGTR
jgi:tetratricopeptide (TPR) repeat protein